MNTFKLMRTYPLQVFRHRVYVPCINLIGLWEDFKRRVRTQKITELRDLGIDPMVGSRCETVSYRKLRQVFKIAKTQGFDKFCDIGCGLGRGLIAASEVGFNDLYGVDISPELIREAQNNLNKRNVSAFLSCSDVDSFLIPSGRLAIYLFNPFGEERMMRLIEKLEKRESETLILYHNPRHFTCFNGDHKVKDITWRHFGLYDETCFVYIIPAQS